MNKSDLKDWTRDMLESEIVNMNAKNFQLQNEVNNLRESNGRLIAQVESSKIQFKELEGKYKVVKRELETSKNNKKTKGENDSSFLLPIFILEYLSNLNTSYPLEGHGYYYKYSGEKCKRQVRFTEGIGCMTEPDGK